MEEKRENRIRTIFNTIEKELDICLGLAMLLLIYYLLENNY